VRCLDKFSYKKETSNNVATKLDNAGKTKFQPTRGRIKEIYKKFPNN